MASKAAVLARADLARRALEALGIAAGQDDVGALGARPAGGLEADAGAAADHDDGLPDERGLACVRLAADVRSDGRRDLAASAFSAAT